MAATVMVVLLVYLVVSMVVNRRVVRNGTVLANRVVGSYVNV